MRINGTARSGLIAIVLASGAISHAAELVTIRVKPDVVKNLTTWDTNIVFLTSAAKPIRSLDEIPKRGGEVGTWGGELYLPVLQLFKQAGVQIYKPDGSTFAVPFRTIGDSYHGKLFIENPNLLLFVTHREFVRPIITTGGGIEVRFEAEKK